MFNTIRETADTAKWYWDAWKEDQGKPAEEQTRLKKFHETVDQCGRKGEFSMASLSLREMFANFVEDGDEALKMMAPGYRGSGVRLLQESGDAINTNHFSNIFSQAAYTEFLRAYESPELIGKQLVTVVQSRTQYEEIIPGVSGLSDLGAAVGEGEVYPKVGLSENYVRMPRKIKTGFQLEVTEETIYEDQNGLISEALNSAATIMAVNEEKELLDVALGISTLYDRNGSGAQATYGDTHTPTAETFDNLAGSNTLVDWTDIENALLLFDAITDPNTGEPIMVGGPMQIVVPSALKMTARNVLNATAIQAGNTTATTPVTMYGNPLSGDGQNYQLLSNQYVKARTSSASTWFIGNFKKAFRYYEIYPIQVLQMPVTQDDRYKRDIVAGLRVRRKGRASVYDPRYVVKCT